MIFTAYQEMSTLSFPYFPLLQNFISEFRWGEQIPEEIEIVGSDLIARPSLCVTKDISESYFEIHQKHIDIHYIVEGVETIQIAPVVALKEAIPYDPVADICFFNANHWISDIIIPSGYMAIFFPEEAHRPLGWYQELPTEVKKIVFKIKKDVWL